METSDIFQGFTEIKNGHNKSTLNFFGVATTQKVTNYSNFKITFPTIWRCAGDICKVLLKFKMAATDQLHNFL